MSILYKLAHELDTEMGAINCNRITLNDVRTLIGHLREDMDNVNVEDVRFHFHEYHRTVRVLEDLLGFVVNDLNGNFEKAFSIKQEMFNITAKQEDFHEDNKAK